MSLAINPGSAVSTAGQTGTVRSAALNQASPADDNAKPVTVAQAPSPADSPSLTAALKALGKSAKLADDLQKVAGALVTSMQQVIENRPDLALASFDFQSSDGAIKVISGSLDASDKAWLEKTLNANQGLISAVNTFHDDATSSYALWAESAGQPLSSSGIDQASTAADQRFGFMGMFQHASHDWAKTMDPHGRYTTASGAPIDFRRPVNSPLDFLIFQKSNQAILDGTNTYTTSTGRTFSGDMRGNFFASTSAIPRFMPDMPSSSVGLHTTA